MPRVPLDGYDQLAWLLDDGPTTFVNAGSLASNGNLTKNQDPVNNIPALFDKDCVYFPGLVSSVRDTLTTSGTDNDLLVNNPITISFWVFLRKNVAQFTQIFGKQIVSGSWSSPFISVGIGLNNTNDGRWNSYVSISSTLNILTTSAANPLPVGRWSHIGFTYDNSTFISYMNGTMVASTALSGAIDYGTLGTRGPWFIGAVPSGSASTEETACNIQDARIASIARAQSYFAEVYYKGYQFYNS